MPYAFTYVPLFAVCAAFWAARWTSVARRTYRWTMGCLSEMVPSDMQPGESSYSGGNETVVEVAAFWTRDGMAVRGVGCVLCAWRGWDSAMCGEGGRHEDVAALAAHADLTLPMHMSPSTLGSTMHRDVLFPAP